MKKINKKTVIVFDGNQDKNTAVDYLLKLKVPFNTINKKPIIVIRATLYTKHCLDLIFNPALTFSTFNYKH